MAMDTNVVGALSGTGADVTASRQLKVILPDGSTAADAAGVAIFSENDAGAITTNRSIRSPETDQDYRFRVSLDTLLEDEIFNYTAQNTAKHNYITTNITSTWTAAGLTLNGSSITTTTSGTLVRSYKTFPILDPGTLAISTAISFSAASVPTNVAIDYGLMLPAAATPFVPLDGVYFRASSAGWTGVINHNGTETSVGPFTFTPVANRVYGFIITVHERQVDFWVDNQLLGSITVPTGQGQVYMSEALPWGIRQAHVGAAGGIFQAVVKNYSVSIGGLQISDTLGEMSNRAVGCYEGLSGGTMGSLASYANSTNPTAAALSNTAALVTGLGGQYAFNAAVAAATDGIVTSFQVPALTVATRNRRLKINGIRIDAVNNGAAVATTATTLQWSLAFGHTAVSLATTEAATTKAPRRIALGLQTWAVGAAIGAGPQNGVIDVNFDSPIYVNPGEFVAVVAKFLIGTATASQTIFGTVTFIHSWE